MTASGSFTCPACGAEFDVQERLGERNEPRPDEAPAEGASPQSLEPVSFQCPACGADYDIEQELSEFPAATPPSDPASSAGRS